MDEKLALEMAYKNGYEQGVKDFAERLKAYLLLPTVKEMSVVTAKDIDKLVKEMTEQITNKN